MGLLEATTTPEEVARETCRLVSSEVIGISRTTSSPNAAIADRSNVGAGEN